MIESKEITKLVDVKEVARYKTNSFIGNRTSLENKFCEEFRKNKVDKFLVDLGCYINEEFGVENKFEPIDGKVDWSARKLSKMGAQEFYEGLEVINEKLELIEEKIELSEDVGRLLEYCLAYKKPFDKLVVQPFLKNRDVLYDELSSWIRFCIKDINNYGTLPEAVSINVGDEKIFLDTRTGELFRKGPEKIISNINDCEKVSPTEYYDEIINELLKRCPDKKFENVQKKSSDTLDLQKLESFGNRLARTYF